MFFISDLHKLKNYLPIIYTGHHDLTVSKLVLICAKLRKNYNLQFFLVIKDSKLLNFSYDFILSESNFSEYKTSFKKMCACKEQEGEDTIMSFAEENQLDIKIDTAQPESNFRCGVFGQSIAKKYEITLRNLGRSLFISDCMKDLCENCGVIYGEECPEIVAAAALGKQIYLLDEHKKMNSFQMMFPSAVIMNVKK